METNRNDILLSMQSISKKEGFEEFIAEEMTDDEVNSIVAVFAVFDSGKKEEVTKFEGPLEKAMDEETQIIFDFKLNN